MVKSSGNRPVGASVAFDSFDFELRRTNLPVDNDGSVSLAPRREISPDSPPAQPKVDGSQAKPVIFRPKLDIVPRPAEPQQPSAPQSQPARKPSTPGMPPLMQDVPLAPLSKGSPSKKGRQPADSSLDPKGVIPARRRSPASGVLGLIAAQNDHAAPTTAASNPIAARTPIKPTVPPLASGTNGAGGPSMAGAAGGLSADRAARLLPRISVRPGVPIRKGLTALGNALSASWRGYSAFCHSIETLAIRSARSGVGALVGGSTRAFGAILHPLLRALNALMRRAGSRLSTLSVRLLKGMASGMVRASAAALKTARFACSVAGSGLFGIAGVSRIVKARGQATFRSGMALAARPLPSLIPRLRAIPALASARLSQFRSQVPPSDGPAAPPSSPDQKSMATAIPTKTATGWFRLPAIGTAAKGKILDIARRWAPRLPHLQLTPVPWRAAAPLLVLVGLCATLVGAVWLVPSSPVHSEIILPIPARPAEPTEEASPPIRDLAGEQQDAPRQVVGNTSDPRDENAVSPADEVAGADEVVSNLIPIAFPSTSPLPPPLPPSDSVPTPQSRPLPPDSPDLTAKLADIPDLNTFTRALRTVGPDSLMQPGRAYTIFAPNDAAFASLDPQTVDGLLTASGHEQLRTLLRNHIVEQRLAFRDFAGTVEAYSSLGDGTVTISATDVVNVSGATMVKADLVATDGIIHIIDKVLWRQGRRP